MTATPSPLCPFAGSLAPCSPFHFLRFGTNAPSREVTRVKWSGITSRQVWQRGSSTRVVGAAESSDRERQAEGTHDSSANEEHVGVKGSVKSCWLIFSLLLGSRAGQHAGSRAVCWLTLACTQAAKSGSETTLTRHSTCSNKVQRWDALSKCPSRNTMRRPCLHPCACQACGSPTSAATHASKEQRP